MANISPNDLLALREYAATYLAYSHAEMEELVEKGTLYRIEAEKEDIDA